MSSVNTSTFLASLLFAAAFAVATTMAMVTVFAGTTTAPTTPMAPVASVEPDARLAKTLDAIEERLAGLEGAPVAMSDAPVVSHDAEYANVLERLRAIEDRLSVMEQTRGPVTATDGDSVTEQAQAAAAPGNINDLIDARIKWLKEDEARRAQEAREQQIIENLERTREWYDRVYDKAVEVMNTELGMSAAQIDSMRRLLEWRGDELLKNQDPRVPQDERRNWQEVNKEFTERVGELLSPQQLQVYNQKKLGDFGAIQRQLWQQDQGNQANQGNGNGAANGAYGRQTRRR